MQGKVIRHGGGHSELNVFAQSAEPSKKDGVWIRTEQTRIPEELTYNKLKDIPYSFMAGTVAVVGTDVYLFGTSINSSYYKYAYKYNTLTDTYTKLKDIPYSFYGGAVAVVGTDIYLFGTAHSSTYASYAYKYNILTNTYTKLKDIPYEFKYGCAVTIDTDIYLFNASYAYKYNTLTDTYIILDTVSGQSRLDVAVIVGNDIYLFSYSSSSDNFSYVYRYDTLTNTYVRLEDVPHGPSKAAVVVGNDIYIFSYSSSSDNFSYVYRYDTLTNTYVRLKDVPYLFSAGDAAAIDTNIYLFGSTTSTTDSKCAYKIGNLNDIIIPQISRYNYEKIKMVDSIKDISNLTNKTIFLEMQNLFKIKLSNSLESYISNARISDGSELLKYISYYGDGEKWIQIKE